MNILIIDDSSDFIAALRLILKNHLVANLVEYPFKEGLPDRDFNWSEYDLLLLDYDLGKDGDGIEWLRDINKSKNVPPVIMLTGEGDEYIAVNAIKLGAVDYLNKVDITPERMVKAVKSACTADRRYKKDYKTLTSVTYHEKQLSDRTDDVSGLIDIGTGYKFVNKIAEGGMSRVYLAERLEDKKTVVLKILDLGADMDEILVNRFIQEAELLSSLHSPFVAEVYDYGLTDDYAFIALEFFSRGDLKQRMVQRLDPEIALTYINHIAYGLEAIHSVGIVHRDLKPANIMFRGDDSLAIADFGIAKRLDAAFNITKVGEILGSPHYMSPQQADGREIDIYADIYSVGILLFELLTNKKPYTGKNAAEIIYKHKYADIPGLPDSLSEYQDLIDRTMAKETINRYDSKRLILALEAKLTEITNV